MLGPMQEIPKKKRRPSFVEHGLAKAVKPYLFAGLTDASPSEVSPTPATSPLLGHPPSMGVPSQLPPRPPSASSFSSRHQQGASSTAAAGGQKYQYQGHFRHERGSIPHSSPRGASPTLFRELMERDRGRSAATRAQSSGIAASTESGIYPYSRRASSIFGPVGHGRRSFGGGLHPGAAERSRSTEGSEENILKERTRSNLTLDEELYDILFAFGEADMYGPHKDDDDDIEHQCKPMTRQLLLDKIRQKKEVINKLRCQAWSMNRKRRTLRLAQKYLEQHESKVSKTHLYKEEFLKRWRMFLRWASNINTYLIPWESRIKKIESHFGSVVSSYFTFLRWVVYINLIMSLLVISFIALPEVIADVTDPDRRNRTRAEKTLPEGEKESADTIDVIWGYNGYLRYSPIFYGYYSNEEFLSTNFKYALPLAYFIIVLAVFGYSFFAILRKMASNASMSKMAGSKAEQYIFNWKVFTGWDYTIGNPETATNTHMAIVIKLRESIAESRVQEREKFECLKFSLRVLANTLIISMIAFSIYIISFAVKDSGTVEHELGGVSLSKNRVPAVISTITHTFPMIFDLIGRMENYHPRTALRAHLARVLVLYVLNYITLIYTLFEKIEHLKVGSDDDKAEGANRSRRQLGGRNPNIDRPPPFASRNFSNRTQMQKFMEGTKKINYEYVTRKPDIIARPDSKAITVQSQFGPVGVNHPNALLRNMTWANGTTKFVNGTKRYSTTKLGPTPLPVITPPPKPPTPKTKTFRTQKFGPDWRATASTGNVETDNAGPKKSKGTGIGVISAHSGKDPSGAGSASENDVEGIDVTLEPFNGTYLDEFGNFTDGNETSFGFTQEPLRDHEAASITSHVCWETLIGQEIIKLVTMDLIITIFSILVIDFFRGLWIRYCSSWWCWDIETTFPEYGEFKVAENVLHIINNQGMIWLGMFFAPMLPTINNLKLIIVLYIRGWAVMSCNVPAREIFRASRSSNFYLMILLLWLFLCTLPVGYVIASKRPSLNCGPFAGQGNFYDVISNLILKHVDEEKLRFLKYIASPGVIIPLVLLLLLIIYFLVSLVKGLREANTDLQAQLIHERTEEKKKIFELAGGGTKKKSTQEPPDRGGKNKEAKKPGQYLPDVEAKRREPWRIFNNTDQNASLCPTDRTESSIASPTSIGSRSPPTIRSRVPREFVPIVQPPSPTKPNFQPSLGSLDEVENSDNPSTSGAEPGPYPLMKTSISGGTAITKDTTLPSMPSMTMSKSKSGLTDRVDDWFAGDNQSERSLELDRSVAVTTPDEIRSILRPYMDSSLSKLNTAISLASFPRDTSNYTVIFGSKRGSTVSRKSSKRDSYASLYDNTNFLSEKLENSYDDVYSNNGAPSRDVSGDFPGLKSTPLGFESKPPKIGGFTSRPYRTQIPKSSSINHDKNAFYTYGVPKEAREAPKEVSTDLPIYTKEPKRIRPSQEKDEPKRAQKIEDGKNGQKKPETSNLVDEFKPWPSIEEVKARRASLTKPPPVPKHRSKSPPKMVKSEHSEPSTSGAPRFRISVSPTRKLPGESSGSDTDTTHSKKRKFVIRQRLLPGSTASIASTSTPTQNQAQKSTPNQSQPKRSDMFLRPGSPLAPRVEFGEDDSPRVQELPPIQKKK